MMLGYLLARAGIEVTVLEKHRDFLRDFRGDTVHPSTLEIMHELGILDKFLQVPHSRIRYATVDIGERRYRMGDFAQLPTACKFLVLMPQWDFLDFLSGQAKTLPTFRLLMESEAKELIIEGQGGGERVAGLTAKGPNGDLRILARLTVAADGRRSVLREQSLLPLLNLGAPFDVLWLRLPLLPDDPTDIIGRVKGGQFFVMIYRGDYWQCAYAIPKGAFEEIKSQGIESFRERLKEIAGFARDRVDAAITDFDHVKLLTVAVNRLQRWARAGLLCIGDAAHAMSPVGGVGINLAVQDAVAAANLLGPILQRRTPYLDELLQVQKRRELPTRIIQSLQVTAQNAILAPTLRATETPPTPGIVKFVDAHPFLQQFPARLVGLGIRQEHVQLPPR